MSIRSSSRRTFFRSVSSILALTGPADTAAAASSPGGQREIKALEIRKIAALINSLLPVPDPVSNGDETSLPSYIGSFSKGLPHDQNGVVDPNAYKSLLQAVTSGSPTDFQNIDRGSGMKLVNPEAAFAFELTGADSHCLACPPCPSLTSAEAAAEMVELYWQAQTRDLAFGDYPTSSVIASAAHDLTKLSAFSGPRDAERGVSPANIFRANFTGVLDGPYISQFLWKPIPLNSTWVQQTWRVPASGIDYLNDYSEWLVLQSGLPSFRTPTFDSTPRYLYNGRGLAEWVHYDFLYQAFHYAALILLNQTPEAILDTNPYYNPTNPYKNSKVETGFSTFGAPHVCGLLGQVAVAALHAAWYQKWCVHRRLRPEAFGGLVHQNLANHATYPLSSDLLNSAAVANIFQKNGNYLLPQAFPEGAPLHPAYPSGHATVAGACSVILKAFFDENELVNDCVVPNSDGTALTPFSAIPLTVGGEINKLAVNIAIGRNFAGIHYRSDAIAGIKLGEQVGMAMLQDLALTFTETFEGFQFSLFDGTKVQIKPNWLDRRVDLPRSPHTGSLRAGYSLAFDDRSRKLQ